jgi:hypothetical protein
LNTAVVGKTRREAWEPSSRGMLFWLYGSIGHKHSLILFLSFQVLRNGVSSSKYPLALFFTEKHFHHHHHHHHHEGLGVFPVP